MTSNFYGGNHVTQYGSHNIGMINNSAADPQAALQEMIAMVRALRSHVSAAEGQRIDESINAIGTGADVRPPVLRRALADLAGIATVAGQVGAPVVEAIRSVMRAFGM